MIRFLSLIALFLLSLTTTSCDAINFHKSDSSNSISSSNTPTLLSTECIWNQAEHNAFTDLIDFQGVLVCCFRESDTHAGGKDGSVRILMSADSVTWIDAALIGKEGVDLRDPKLSIMPDGRLMLTLGGSIYKHGKLVGLIPHVAFSEDGILWSEPQPIDLKNEWIWRVTWFQDVGYAVSYQITDPQDLQKPWILTLIQTQDGIHYTPITILDVPDHPNETTLRVSEDGTMIAFTRREGNGWIGASQHPYTTWNWNDAGIHVGGPNFLILPDGQMWGASRLIVKEGKEINRFTAIGRMTLASYIPELIFPSGNDTSYPGMVYRDHILYVSYYSAHEGKPNIYLAKVRL